MQGINLLNNIYVYIIGVDMVCNNDGQYYVLEDNLCMLFGVFYMFENCKMMMCFYLEMFEQYYIVLVECYLSYFLQILCESLLVDDFCVVVMILGCFNNVYFEYSFLVQQMGVELVESVDLFIKNGVVYMCIIEGLWWVDVIYCCIDDVWFDLLVFCVDLMFGVLGLLFVYCVGGVVLVNVIGIGVVDDKLIYLYVLEMICFYFGEQLIFSNIFIWQCWKVEDLCYVLSNFELMVVKEVYGVGGYGMLVGLCFIKEEWEVFCQCLLVNLVNYIVQDIFVLLICFIFVDEGLLL